jgi:hypothetical protein
MTDLEVSTVKVFFSLSPRIKETVKRPVEGLMLEIEKVDESNKQHVINLLGFDVVHHVFAFYDIQYEPQHTSMYVAFENEGLKGYVLIYTALDFPTLFWKANVALRRDCWTMPLKTGS